MEQFPDHESCINHLEKVRWTGKPHCPHCASLKVVRKAEKQRVGRWNCHDCQSSFNVLSKTMFQGTHISLQKWFMAISLVMNAKKSLSSYQLARDLDLNQKTAWYMMQGIRAEMASQDKTLLQGIIEADETYVGGKPRKRNKRKDDEPKNKRGRGTKKTPIVGAVERGGKVIARMFTELTGRKILDFIQENVNPDESVLITDEYQAYNAVRDMIDHKVIRHQQQYVDGDIHTNTIEGFWSLLKRAWYGSHHHYRKQFTPLYIAEACYKYNNRKNEDIFNKFIGQCFNT